MEGAYNKLMGIIGGYGGKIIAGITALFGFIGWVVKFNASAIVTFFAVAIGVGTVSTIVDSTITCLLNF